MEWEEKQKSCLSGVTCILQAMARSWEWTPPDSQSTTCHPLCSSKDTTSVFSCEKGYKPAIPLFTFNSFQQNRLGYLLLAVCFVCICLHWVCVEIEIMHSHEFPWTRICPDFWTRSARRVCASTHDTVALCPTLLPSTELRVSASAS